MLRIESESQLRDVLASIEVGPFMDFHWRWEVAAATVAGQPGWGLSVSFIGLDRDTSSPNVFRSRAEYVARGAEESAVVKTAWLLLELAVRHELMEAFRYRGVRLFDPHHSVEQLARGAGRALRPLEGVSDR